MSGRNLQTYLSLAAISVCLGTSACQLCPGSDEPAESLIDSLDRTRPFEVRLSGGFEYAKCERDGVRASVRCTPIPPPGSEAFVELARISTRIGGETPAHLHAQALWHLVWHDGVESLDKAIAKLTKALESTPANARLWNDLSAAYYIRAVEEESPYDFIRALSAIETALEGERFDEAVFNRALILERLHLRRQAMESWDEYTDRFDGSAFAADARAHREHLSDPTIAERWESKRDEILAAPEGSLEEVNELVELSPQLTREWGMSHLLESWAEAHLARRKVDDRGWRELAHHVGLALRRATGDATVSGAVTVLRRCDQDLGTGDRTARAILDFTEGQRLFKELRIEKAKPYLKRAREELMEVGGPLGDWVRFYLAGLHYYRGDYEEAVADFADVERLARSKSYHALAGRSAWGVGLSTARQLRRTESLGHYRDALHSFTAARERENSAAVHVLIADQLALLGRVEDAWTHRHRALRNLAEFRESRRLKSLLNTAAEAQAARSYPRAALVLQNESVALTETSRNPQESVEARLRRARMLIHLGRAREARADIAASRQALSGVSDGTMKSKLEAHLSLAQAHLEVRQKPTRAVELFTRAIGDFETTGYALGRIEGHLGRAGALAELERLAGAERDLGSAVALFEKQHRLLDDARSRESLLLAAADVFDRLVTLALARGDVVRALHFSDRSRDIDGTSLGAWDQGSSERETRFLRDLQRRLDPSSRILEYALVNDELLTWAVSREDVRFFRKPLDTSELRQTIEAFLKEAKAGTRETGASSRLYELLVPPEVRDLPESVRFHFVPEKLLNGIPFAALVNPETKRYLVEERTTGILPAAARLLRNGGASTRRAGRRETALLVGEPAHDRRIFPWLGELPGASEELESVRAIYRNAEVLRGEAATKEAFLAALPGKSLVHYAGHAVFSPANPSSSYLVLAGNADGEAAVFARELADLPDAPELVVLSACRTAAAVPTRTGALSGLARPFLLGGTGDVLGSLWELPDPSGPEFFRVFYESYREGASAREALRHAQLALLRSRDHQAPVFWAGYVLLSSRI